MAIDKIQTTIRLDEKLHNELLQLAEREDRSLNAQMILLMKIGMQHYKTNIKAKRRQEKKD